jgi:hypothetical protein
MRSSRLKTSVLWGAFVVGCVSLGGCSVHAQPEPVVGYSEVTSAEVESRPYLIYEGHPTYYVNERWVYRDRDRWVYYRDEPPELYRQRQYVQQPPRAPRYTPQPRTTRPVTAPPAERVQ